MSIKVKYLSDVPEGEFRAFGVTFEKGVGEVHETFRKKVEGNRFFEIVGGKAAKTDDETGLKAEHRGGGKFNVTHGEEVLLKGLSKAEADAFNAMSEEDKAEYVKAEAAKTEDSK